jgi:hypothetical protein
MFMCLLWEPPKTAFRSWLDGGVSVDVMDCLMAALFAGVFLTFEFLMVTGFRSFWFFS